MVAFFRGNYPTRLIGLLLLFLVLRVPLLVWGVPLLQQDLHHLLVGERLAEGFRLYRELYHPVAPLSAFVFWVLHLLAGRSAAVMAALGSLLVLLQALRLNMLLNRNRVHTDKSYLPALLYVLAGSIFFEFDRLSPVLLGVTFLDCRTYHCPLCAKRGRPYFRSRN